MVCVIVYGVVECYFIMPPDTPKGSDMEMTVISRAMDVAQSLLPPGTKLPHSFCLAADNTAKEMKNQYGATFSAYNVSQDKVEGIENAFQKTGHSHFDVDQRFSECNTIMKTAGTLETPYECKEFMEANMKPVRGRALHVEVLETVKNFKKFFAPLQMALQGLAATHNALDTCHSWKFVQRRVLPMDIDEKLIDNQHPDWQNLPAHPRDVILLVKESLSSSALAQPPLLVLPAQVADTLDPSTLENMPRDCLKPLEIKEFRKTGSTVAGHPWNFFGAQAWLETLCTASEQNQPLDDLPLPWFQFYKMNPRPDAVSSYGTASVTQPRTITLTRPTPGATAKRMGITAKAKVMLKKRPAAASLPASAPKKKAKSKAMPPAAGSGPLGRMWLSTLCTNLQLAGKGGI